MLRAAVIASLALLAAPPLSPAAPPRKVSAIPLPGVQPLAIALDQSRDRLFVTDDNSGDLLIVDVATERVVRRVHVGRAAFALAVNERYGKVYVGSEDDPVTTGIGDGNGLISIVDADTGAIIRQIDPAVNEFFGGGFAKYYQLEADEAHGRIYTTFACLFADDCTGLGVIDAATDSYAPLGGPGDELRADSGMAINATTNELFIPEVAENRIVIVDGGTGAVDSYDLKKETGSTSPLDIAVNEAENKIYVTMILIPGQNRMGILVVDRDTGAHRFVGREDLEPLVFNPLTNRLFSGVQVGQRGAVVDGRTDALRYVKLGGGGFGTAEVRRSTDNAYFVSQNETYVLNGATRCTEEVPTGIRERSGLVMSSVAISQRTGRVYAINDDKRPEITVVRDGTVRCVVPKLVGKRLAAAKRILRRAHFRLGDVRRRAAASRKVGRVLVQRPFAGARRAPGAKVGVVIGR